jgi:serine protease Do
VVSIESHGKRGKRQPRRDDDMQLPGGPRGLFPPLPRRIDDEEEDNRPHPIGFGSGFLVSAKGVIVTNHHVVANAERVTVKLHDGRKFVSKDIKGDAKTDVAIIRITSKLPLPFLQFGSSADMEVGDRVLAVGAPFGLTGTVTHGIISAKGRALAMNPYEDFLQTDAAINPGNSGGPLVSLDGKVIGVNSAIKSRSGGFQGVGLAVSSNLAQRIAETLLKYGVVKRGFLGVTMRDIKDEEEAKKLGLKSARGVVVEDLVEDGPAAKGKVQVGDVVVSVAGKSVKNMRQMRDLVAGLEVGKTVAMRVLREGKEKGLKVTIAEQPADLGMRSIPKLRGAVSLEKAGLEVADLTAEWRLRLGFKGVKKGALISKLAENGLAFTAGLRPGMVITAVDGKAVTSGKTAAAAIKAGSLAKGVRLKVESPGGKKAEVVLRESEED